MAFEERDEVEVQVGWDKVDLKFEVNNSTLGFWFDVVIVVLWENRK